MTFNLVRDDVKDKTSNLKLKKPVYCLLLQELSLKTYLISYLKVYKLQI